MNTINLKSNLTSELFDYVRKCNEDNWDEAGAGKITLETAELATKILWLLPDYILLNIQLFGEPIYHENGNSGISFEWYKEKGKIFVISVFGEQSILTYAGFLSSFNSRIKGRDENINKVKDLIPFIERVLYE
jgi:hypothetical protein